VARELDARIISSYKLHAVNYLAMEMVKKDSLDLSTLPALLGLSASEIGRKRREFQERLNSMPKHLQPYVLNMYANPVIRKAEVGAA